MNERVQEFRVGVVALGTLLITAILVLWFGDPVAMVRQRYTIFIAIPDAPGVRTNTPVRKSGIRIGQITAVSFAEDLNLDFRGVILTAEIDHDRKIYRNEVAQVGASLLGDSAVEVVDRGDPALRGQLVEPGATIVGVSPQDPVRALENLGGDLSVAITSVAKTSDEIALLARRVNDLFGENQEQIGRIVDKTEVAIDQISQSMTNLNDVLGDPLLKQNLQRTINELPVVLSEMTKAIGGIQNTLRLADQNLANLEGLTEPLGQKAGPLIDKVDRAAAQLENTISEFAIFARNLNSSEGSLSRLLKDPELYDQLASTIDNVNRLTVELKPILRDARVFTDKIARHPEQLGVRGAIQRSSGLK